jgi:hypothetical protein
MHVCPRSSPRRHWLFFSSLAVRREATTDGERVAAAEARKRIQLRLQKAEQREDAVDFRFSLGDAWARKVLVALLRRYDLKPFRYRGQRRTTVMVKVPPSFVKDTLWPEFEQITAAIRSCVERSPTAFSPR